MTWRLNEPLPTVTTAQFNTSGFTGSVSTYFTIGTSDSSTITISFGVEIILKMTKEKTFTFVFVLQVSIPFLYYTYCTAISMQFNRKCCCILFI